MKWWVGLFVSLLSIFLIHYNISGQAVYGDGIDYWVYLHSVYFDNDIDFTNEYKHNFNPKNNNSLDPIESPVVLKTVITPIGNTDNPHTPGMSLLISPFFITADGLTIILRRAGLIIPRNGYADLYQVLVGAGGVFYTVWGTYFLFKTLVLFGGKPKLARLTSTVLVLSSPMLYYGGYDVINSHFATFFLTSLLFYLLVKNGDKTPKSGFILGSIFGLMVLTRLQDILWILPIGIFWWNEKRTLSVNYLLSFGVGAIIFILPLFFIWNYLYGALYPHYYLTRGHIFRGFSGSLFHPVNGLFSRTPILLISLVGIVEAFKVKEFRLAILSFIILFIATYGLVTFQGGWQDPAYGGRMYLSLLPLFGVMLMIVFQQFVKRFDFRLLSILASLMILINCLSIGSFVLREKAVHSGEKRGLEEHTVLKLYRRFPTFMWVFE